MSRNVTVPLASSHGEAKLSVTINPEAALNIVATLEAVALLMITKGRLDTACQGFLRCADILLSIIEQLEKKNHKIPRLIVVAHT
jgi:hypothetical protein